jgi:hypothetical protein
MHAWENGAAKFRVLNDEEWEAWEAARLQAALEEMGGGEGGEGGSDHDSTERDHIIPCDDPQSKLALDLLVPVSGALQVSETTQDLGAQPSTGSRRPSPKHDDLPISKRRKQAPGKSSFINTLTSADGTPIATAKKA